MNKRIHIAWGVSVFAIACLLILQGFWLIRTIQYKKVEYLNMVNNVLAKAVETGFEEHLVRNQTIRQNYPQVGVDLDKRTIGLVWRGDTTVMSFDNENGYLGALRKVCYDFINQQSAENIVMLDSICRLYFERNGITDNYILELVDTKSGNIIATTENGSSNVNKYIISNVVELGMKSHHGLIAYFGIPYRSFFAQMTSILVSSFLIMIFLVICSIYQVKTISFQRNVAKVREEFMSSMVHELKFPLSIIKKKLLALKQEGVDNLNERQLEALNGGFDRVLHLNNFVFKLLNAWKQGFKVTWEKLSLQDSIDELVRQFNSVFEKRNVSIKVDYQLSRNVIEADPIHFPNAISNLIENAIKYSGGSPKVEISCKDEGNMLIISVKDHGFGIPEKLREKIFERYFRVARGRSADVHGFGIGLSYVKQVIEAHGGVIRVDSTEGVGTTFTVMVPLVTDEND
ncbi:HAMP domain-containing sensor histidine kinase [Butyricimonas sp.]|uniref:sensor histidine kinase n=1 Tax=Butyricimonas sp. TaxID=1969738 RepID=UPI0025BF1C50|nr:HAMP domain-containing sensor histidine kinase [Butyricimonas sp.]